MASAADWDSLHSILLRAQQAIARARSLSEQLSEPLSPLSTAPNARAGSGHGRRSSIELQQDVEDALASYNPSTSDTTNTNAPWPISPTRSPVVLDQSQAVGNPPVARASCDSSTSSSDSAWQLPSVMQHCWHGSHSAHSSTSTSFHTCTHSPLSSPSHTTASTTGAAHTATGAPPQQNTCLTGPTLHTCSAWQGHCAPSPPAPDPIPLPATCPHPPLQHAPSSSPYPPACPPACPREPSCSPPADLHDPQPASTQGGATSAGMHQAGAPGGSGTIAGGPGSGIASIPMLALSTARPLLAMAQRLAQLQRQQNATLTQLLSLRFEQLRLRQQQLAALQELLLAEALAVAGTPLQMSAVQQALSLLAHSLEDMHLAYLAIASTTHSGDVASVARTVAEADTRAEDISRMARQLLGVLREYPRRESLQGPPAPWAPAAGVGLQGEEARLSAALMGRTVVRGATAAEVGGVPLQLCTLDHPLLGELCPICLAEYGEGEELRVMACAHAAHSACLDLWLATKACCPLCKLVLPGTEVQVVSVLQAMGLAGELGAPQQQQ